MKSTFPFDNCRPRWRTDGRPGFCGHGLSCMIKRVISADNVMDTALVRLFVERGLQQLGQIANVTEQGNKDSITNYIPLLNYNLDMYMLIFHIIRIILCLLNVLHLISSAGSPFVTPWQSITRKLSLCGNLSQAQRRVSVTAQLAPRAGGPQVATAGTVSFHSDLLPLVSAQPPWGAPRWEGQWCHHWATVTGGRSVRHRNGTKHFCRGQPISKGHYCDAPSLRQN